MALVSQVLRRLCHAIVVVQCVVILILTAHLLVLAVKRCIVVVSVNALILLQIFFELTPQVCVTCHQFWQLIQLEDASQITDGHLELLQIIIEHEQEVKLAVCGKGLHIFPVLVDELG